MRQRLALAVAITALGAGLVARTAETEQARAPIGTICIVAVPADPDPRAYISEHFGVRLDQRPWVAVSAVKATRIADLDAGARHLVSIRDGKKVMEAELIDARRFDRIDPLEFSRP